MKTSFIKWLSPLICLSFLAQPVKATASEDLVIGSLLGLAVGLSIDNTTRHTSVVREVHVTNSPGFRHHHYNPPLRRHYSTHNYHHPRRDRYSRHEIRQDLREARRDEERALRDLERAERRADRAERRLERRHHRYHNRQHSYHYDRYERHDRPRRQISEIRTFERKVYSPHQSSVRARYGQ